jgi:hypothetical protein
VSIAQRRRFSLYHPGLRFASVGSSHAVDDSEERAEASSPASGPLDVAAAGAGSGMAARAATPFSGADRRRRANADPDPDHAPPFSGAARRRRWNAYPGPRRTRTYGVIAAVLVLGAVVVPLVPQMPRDYLFGWKQSSSQFEGSRYVALLASLGTPADVVETDYTSTTALFTGHRTANTAFLNAVTECPDPSATLAAISGDNGGYLLLGDVNKPGLMDSPCLLGQAATNPWGVPLLHTARDDGFVYELIGPGTGHPDLENLNAGVQPRSSSSAASSVIEYDWGGPRTVQQVSIGEATSTATPTTSVQVELRTAAGRWLNVAGAHSAVGDGPGRAPYLLATFPDGRVATGLRVVVTGTQTEASASASVSDVAALGPSAPTT